MNEDTVLEELYRETVTFPGPDLRLAGLRAALTAVEEQLAHARAQTTLRLNARHKRDTDTIHPDDRDLDLYQLDVTINQILPRVFRGGFVLILWSEFEVISRRMAEYACLEKGAASGQSQWKKRTNETFLDVLERVYLQTLGIVAFPDPLERAQLDQLRVVRNALIHHNGSVTELPKSMQAEGPEGYSALGLYHYTELRNEGFIVPNAEFLSRKLAFVETNLRALAKRVYVVAHPGSPS